MGRDRRGYQPLVGWLLGLLLAFCSVMPVAFAPVGSHDAAPGTATLARSSNSQHFEAVAAPLRPGVARSPLHHSPAISAGQLDSLTVSCGNAADAHTTAAFFTSLMLSGPRAPPSLRA